MMEPTVRPFPNFDASSDSEKLRKAMKGLGTDENVIIDVLTKRSEDQRLQIVKEFKTMYGKDLIKEFQSEMGGKLLKVVEALCHSTADFAAMQLRSAMKGAGTDEEALIELLCTKTNEQLKEMMEAYHRLYPKRNLEKDIQSETSGHFKRLLISQLQADREESPTVNQQAAQEDARRLYEAGENKLGTDESTFNMIMCSKSYAYLRTVFADYETISKNSIEKAIKNEMSGDLCTSQLAIVGCVLNKQKFFAQRLHKSMEGAGTDDTTLIRIIVSRSEIDLGRIKQEYEREFKKSLAAAVKGDTSGDYEKILLALIG